MGLGQPQPGLVRGRPAVRPDRGVDHPRRPAARAGGVARGEGLHLMADHTGPDPDAPADLDATPAIRPEDERIPLGKSLIYGLQHILAMYAGVVSPPIIIASAAGLNPRATALLVTAALFVSGLGTLLQSLGGPYVGSPLPPGAGVSFAAVGTMTAVATDASLGDSNARLATIFGAVIVAGLFGFVIAPVFA